MSSHDVRPSHRKPDVVPCGFAPRPRPIMIGLAPLLLSVVDRAEALMHGGSEAEALRGEA
jgi:hypothetical protein